MARLGYRKTRGLEKHVPNEDDKQNAAEPTQEYLHPAVPFAANQPPLLLTHRAVENVAEVPFTGDSDEAYQ